MGLTLGLIGAGGSIPTVLATRTYIMPNISDPIAGIPKDNMLMLLFAVLMILSAMFMLSPAKVKFNASNRVDVSSATKLIFGSAGVGLLTGMMGAGGGFLIIPTLIALFNLQMKEAIGTSFAIIAIHSLVGFTGDLSVGITLD